MVRAGLFILAAAFAGCFSSVVQADGSQTPGKRAAFGTFDLPWFTPERGFSSTAIVGGRFSVSNRWSASLGAGMSVQKRRATLTNAGAMGVDVTNETRIYDAAFGLRRMGEISEYYRYFAEIMLASGVGSSRLWQGQQYAYSKSKTLAMGGYLGVEVFLHPRVGIEGKIGLKARHVESKGDVQASRQTYAESVSSTLTLNWYF